MFTCNPANNQKTFVLRMFYSSSSSNHLNKAVCWFNIIYQQIKQIKTIPVDRPFNLFANSFNTL